MRRPTAIAAAAIAITLFAVSCGGGGAPTTPSGGGGSTPATTVVISITGQGGKLAFSPNPATVGAGQLIAFKNNDVVAHHVILDDGVAQTPDIQPGATSAAMPIGANKSYHCTIHPGMVGGFNGTQGEPPPNCNSAYCGG
jgi:plastocyanin